MDVTPEPSRRRRWVAGGVVLAVVAGGAGLLLRAETEGPPPAETYETASELTGALEAAGVEVQVIDSLDGSGRSSAYCTIDGVPVYVVVYEDRARADKTVELGLLSVREADPEFPESFVIGPNWIVKSYRSADAATTAGSIRDAIGGRITK